MAMPIRLDDDGLQVAVSDQPSVAARALLTQSTDHPIRFVLAPESDIQWAIDSSYRAIGGVDTLVEAFEAVEGHRRRASETDETEVVSDDAPIVQSCPGSSPRPSATVHRTSTSSHRKKSSACASASTAL